MSTDKTLADVQPGGTVRLEDQGERARFEAWNRENWPNLDLSRGPLGDYMQARVRSDWQLWQAALAAQPSPGGQGDALKALDDLAAFCSDDTATVDRHVAVIRAALAARQPVGVPAAWMHTHKATGRVEFGLSPMYDCDFNAVQWDSVALYAAPAQAVDLERFRPAVMTALGLSSPYGLERETLNELLDLIDGKAVGK